MKLYQINEAILNALDRLNFDEKTGEIDDNTNDVLDELESLEMEKKSILEYLAKVVLNARSEAAAIKEEENRLKERRKKLEKKDKKIVEILDRECGQKTDLGIATLSYRRSESVNVTDKEKAVKWLMDNNEKCLKITEPEIKKTEVKSLIKGGTEVPGCVLEKNMNVLLK